VYGLMFAQRNPAARVTGLDWPNVLEVAKENARKWGVADRYKTIEGSAFEVDLGGPYDVILLPNFLHHFGPSKCVELLKKVRGALVNGGKVIMVEFIPDQDRVKPEGAASFALIMLAHTPAGAAYTFTELQEMFRKAGFARSEMREMEGTMSRAVISE